MQPGETKEEAETEEERDLAMGSMTVPARVTTRGLIIFRWAVLDTRVVVVHYGGGGPPWRWWCTMIEMIVVAMVPAYLGTKVSPTGALMEASKSETLVNGKGMELTWRGGGGREEGGVWEGGV